MTDKQIIIDGVPVQDCCYFDYENDGYEDSCYIHQNECSAQNCYYKQLKRKEQECEELKEELEELKEENEYNEANAIEFKQTLVEICLNVETLRLNIGGIEIMWNNNPEEWQDDILQDFATCRRLIQEIQQKISEVEDE